MDLHGHAPNGMALANGTILMGLINHLIAKNTVSADDIRSIMDDAIKGIASGNNRKSVASIEARTIINKMRDSI